MENKDELVRARAMLTLFKANRTAYPEYLFYWDELSTAIKDVIRVPINLKDQLDNIADRTLEIYGWLLKDLNDEHTISTSSEDRVDC